MNTETTRTFPKLTEEERNERRALRAKIRQQVEMAKLIRDQANASTGPARHNHHMTARSSGRHTRAMHLALTYIRGFNYRRAEQRTRTPANPDWVFAEIFKVTSDERMTRADGPSLEKIRTWLSEPEVVLPKIERQRFLSVTKHEEGHYTATLDVSRMFKETNPELAKSVRLTAYGKTRAEAVASAYDVAKRISTKEPANG